MSTLSCPLTKIQLTNGVEPSHIQWKLLEQSALGREKGVRNWSWSLTGIKKNKEFVCELSKTGFCEGGCE